MPELAEVEYFRRRWDDGLGQRVLGVKLHLENRVFRGSETNSIQMTLPRKKLVSSETRGKQILFRFSNGAWLGIHLGMSGKLRVEAADFPPGSTIIWRYFKKGARCFSPTRERSDGSAFTLGRRCRAGG